MGKITVEVKINTFGNMLYSLNHPNVDTLIDMAVSNKMIYSCILCKDKQVVIYTIYIALTEVIRTFEFSYGNEYIKTLLSITY